MTNTELRILQNNLHKNTERTHSILSDPDTEGYGILMLQEQHWSSFTKSSPLHHAWTLIEASALESTQPRAAIYTNNNLIPPSHITPLDLPFSDAVAITIAMSETRPLLPGDKSIIAELHEYMCQS